MIPEEVICRLTHQTPTKIVLLVMDGLGGAPNGGRTELEAADIPCLNRLANESEVGLTDPVARGITPGSGPSHLALFGYDPFKYEIGRGVLEALGVGLEMTDRDVAARANYAAKKGNVIKSRRATDPHHPAAQTRLPTEKNLELSSKLAKAIPRIRDVEVIIKPGKEHRLTILFRGDGLDDRLSDADPQKDKLPAVPARALAQEAQRTADIVNEFIRAAEEVLKEDYPANTLLMRGFAKYPKIPKMGELFKLQPAAIATYPMYRGLARLVGMKVLDTGDSIEDQFNALRREYAAHDFFYLHVKKTDSYGEDGNFDQKVAMIEEVDRHIPALLALEPDVIVVTADHSTPAVLKGHSWHPCPFLLWSKYCRPDGVARFTEKECARGSLGRFPAKEAMALMLANALKMEKFGA